MPSALLLRRTPWLILAFAVLATTCGPLQAIEMFTYFGDGSRIGLPSLEVPVEAYPGIPLRSDRIRARRRAMRMGYPTAQEAPRGPSQTITIRAMPESIEATPAARPAPAALKRTKPKPTRQAVEEVPVAPEPEALISPPASE